MGAPGLLGGGLEARGVRGEGRHGDVHVGAAQRLLPVLGAALADVPSTAARAAIPSRNSGAKLSSDACGTPSASRPW